MLTLSDKINLCLNLNEFVQVCWSRYSDLKHSIVHSRSANGLGKVQKQYSKFAGYIPLNLFKCILISLDHKVSKARDDHRV